MINTWFEAFLFFLPAGLANMAPVLFNKVPLYNKWDTSLDFGKSFRGKRIFGDNKKWRGLIAGVAVGKLAGIIIFPHLFPEMSYFWHAWLGALLGFGALMGDAVESFFKRQVGKKPGDAWFPFDQTDYIIGGLLAASVMVPLNHWWQAGSILVIYFGLHLIVSYIGHHLKFKDKPI